MDSVYTVIVFNHRADTRIAIECPNREIAEKVRAIIAVKYYGRPDISGGRGMDIIVINGSIYPTHRITNGRIMAA